MLKRCLALLSLVVIWSCGKYPSGAENGTHVMPADMRPKNIILMIGDGMGIAQITAAMYLNGNSLHMERFPVVGLLKTHSANNLVTDSAAAATAMASGVKTNNGMVGMSIDTTPVKTILQEAKEHGLATGLVVTSTITHATPAAFVAHVHNRSLQEDIAEYFLLTEVDFFVGGGRKFFNRRQDGRNLLEELAARGYYVSSFLQDEFADISVDFNRKFAYFTADGDPLPLSKGRDYLPPASRMAATFLNNHSDKGFFLMVEGSQIDWAGHAKDTDYLIQEMLDFDRAIGAILDFAEEDGRTLVIVASDHETGGFSINPGSSMNKILGAFTTDYHTANVVPVLAYGPGAEIFAGTYENTSIHEKMRRCFGFSGRLAQ
jgi:alkaline phosphatase